MKRLFLVVMVVIVAAVLASGCSQRHVKTPDGAEYTQTDLFTQSEVTDFHVEKTGNDWAAGFSKASRSVDESLAKTLETNARVMEKMADKVPDVIP